MGTAEGGSASGQAGVLSKDVRPTDIYGLEGCLLPTVSPGAELCLRTVVRVSKEQMWSAWLTVACPVATLCKV